MLSGTRISPAAANWAAHAGVVPLMNSLGAHYQFGHRSVPSGRRLQPSPPPPVLTRAGCRKPAIWGGSDGGAAARCQTPVTGQVGMVGGRTRPGPPREWQEAPSAGADDCRREKVAVLFHLTARLGWAAITPLRSLGTMRVGKGSCCQYKLH